MEERNIELKVKKICRFCMTQSDKLLTNIYSRENRLKNSSVPLPLQIMSISSIEVFTNDGMPSFICEQCRLLMDHCYRFKQICKKSDTMLRQYPLTGVWPKQMELPKLPIEPKVEIVKLPIVQKKRPASKSPATSPVKKLREDIHVEPQMVVLNASPPKLKPVKILNKSAPKILNTNVRQNRKEMMNEAILSDPIIKTDEEGNVEIITELLDTVESYEEPDPIKFAPPVETNVFSCDQCERSFPLRQLLEIHMANHTRERNFECSICMKRFFSKYDLGKHILIHTGEKSFECVVCKKRFSRSTLLHRHEKVHTDQPRFLCIYCDKTFLCQNELDRHTTLHKKNRPFACNACGKSFAFKQGLERHEVVHEKEQPHPCEYCDKSFTTSSKLARHLTAHAGARPYPCKLCPKSFLLSHHLTRHLRSHFAGAGSYKCVDCDSVFSARDDLIYHSAVHATQNLVCPLCKEHFEDIDSVTEHIKSHTQGEQCPCDYCDLIFTSPPKLEEHCITEHADYHKGNELSIKVERNVEDGSGNEYVLEEIGAELARDNVSIRSYAKMPTTTKTTRGTNNKTSTGSKTYKTKKIEKFNEDNADKANSEVEVLAEFEIRRSARSTTKIKDYAEMIKTELSDDYIDDEDHNADMTLQSIIEETTKEDDDDYEDVDDGDEEYILGDQSNDEEEFLPPKKTSPKQKNTIQTPKQQPKIQSQTIKTPTSSQEKITKFLKVSSDKTTTTPKRDDINVESDKSKSVQNVIKNLPKGVTILKKETPKIKKEEKLLSPKLEKSTKSTTAVSSESSSTDNNKSLDKTTVKKNTSSPKELKKVSTEVKNKISSPPPTTNQQTKSSSSIKKSSQSSNEVTPTTSTKTTPKNSDDKKLITRKSAGQQSAEKKKSSSSTETTPTPSDEKKPQTKLIEMKIGDKMVMVQKIMMTKDQVNSMKKEGKIEMKGGQMLFKSVGKNVPKKKE